MLNLWELHFMRNRVFYIISEFLGYKTPGGFAGLQVKHIFNFTTHYQKYSLKKKNNLFYVNTFQAFVANLMKKNGICYFQLHFPNY